MMEQSLIKPGLDSVLILDIYLIAFWGMVMIIGGSFKLAEWIYKMIRGLQRRV